MDIVCDLPFTLKLIKNFPTYIETKAKLFYKEENDIWKNNLITLLAEENEEIEIYFNAEDENSRLYLEALDIVPLDDTNIKEDDDGRIYRTVSDDKFVLYKSNAGYDALRVDIFRISVYCQNEWFYGTLQVLPKPMSVSEWQMMKEDLEREICGLAQDIVRRNIGLGNNHSEKIPPKVIYDFFVMKKYSEKVMMALMDISENPRSEIITMYENVSNSKGDSYKFDAETVKRYAIKSGSEPTYKVPIKAINYDIQDNRVLKMIISNYESRLKQFTDLIDEVEKFSNSPNSGGSVQYKVSWNKSLTDFRATAVKLRKMTAIIKTQEWYSFVGDFKEPYIPHSFILDSRYNLLYQMYLDLKKDEMNVELNPKFSYTWKRSSYMYEMWCYLKICRILMTEYELMTEDWNAVFSDKVLFPFLESGTKIRFKTSNLELDVIYDMCLPMRRENTSISNPLYIAKNHSEYRNHNRPDILIHIYNNEKQWYLGTIILECKYRKLNSFWQENSSRSSRGQLETYYNNARSNMLFGGKEEMQDMRPVSKVIVLTPDDLGEGKEQEDFKILVKGFKASDGDERINQVKTVLMNEIEKVERKYNKLKGL